MSTIETQAVETHPTDARATEAHPTDARATEAHPTDARATEAHPTDARATKAHPTDVATRLLLAVDTLDWDGVAAALAPTVTTDYTSLWGGEPETLAAGELIGRWRELLTGFDATQHLTGPVVVTSADGDRATCATTVRGYHHVAGAGGGTWMCAGRYEMGLARTSGGWRVAAITLHVAYEDGDRGLVDVARSRGAAQAGGRWDRAQGPRD
ncbi:MAG TPA: nuclear transport factor 2 family protein [Acidimicrobiales bacterium]